MQNLIWEKLATHYENIKSLDMRSEFQQDIKRTERFSLQAPEIFCDYSKNLIQNKTLDLLIQLAKNSHLKQEINHLFSGEKINNTENRAVLHTALRNRSNEAVYVDNENIMPKINKILKKIRDFTDQVRSGAWLGHTGKPITDIINIGIGGSDLGPKMVSHALSAYATRGNNLPTLKMHYVSNIDASQIITTLDSLNPETCLFCVASKTFTTLETLTNAETARKWLIEKLGDTNAVAKHFCAISTNINKTTEFGIDPNNIFEFWDWVGGRYSVWSAIGLSTALFIGMDNFEEFLSGAYDMDQHFKLADFDKNLPVILALLGVWYREYFKTGSYAMIPYDHYLQYLPNFLQQLDMESNGKTILKNGEKISHPTGPVIWGGIGTDSQHSFHQWLHQSPDFVPIDFIIAKKPIYNIRHHHALLYANCLAQSQALLQGKSKAIAKQELLEQNYAEAQAEFLSQHKFMPGNRPSNTLVLNKLTPKSMGALVALYEHKVFVQGVIWGINSFDQWGVELGKQLASVLYPALTSTQDLSAYDPSTQRLMKYYEE